MSDDCRGPPQLQRGHFRQGSLILFFRVFAICRCFFNLHGSLEQGRYQALGHFDARNFPRLYSLKFLVYFVLFFWCGMALHYQHAQSLVLKSLNAEFGKGYYLGVLLSSKVQSSFAKVSVSSPSFV